MSNTYFTHFAKLNETEELEIEVRYNLGGTSWYDGKARPRGIKVMMTPCERVQRDGYMSKTTTLGDDCGRSFHVVDLKRLSQKQGERLAAYVAEHIDDLSAAGTQQDWQGVADILFAYK